MTEHVGCMAQKKSETTVVSKRRKDIYTWMEHGGRNVSARIGRRCPLEFRKIITLPKYQVSLHLGLTLRQTILLTVIARKMFSGSSVVQFGHYGNFLLPPCRRRVSQWEPDWACMSWDLAECRTADIIQPGLSSTDAL